MKICPDCHLRFVATEWQCPGCDYRPKRILDFPSFAPELALGGQGFKGEYFDELVLLEAENFWFRARNRLIVWALQKYFPDAKSFLEIGCGTGFVLSGIRDSLPHLNLFGSELFSAGLIHSSNRTPDADLFQMDARNIPYENEFGVIGAFDVLEHISEDNIVLQQMLQAVRPNGGILLTVPQHPFLWSKSDDYACHVRRYTSKILKKRVLRAGFSISRTTSFVSLLLPFMTMSRLIPHRQKDYDPLSELRLSKSVNLLFEKCLDIEMIFIKHGINLCLGGSLLLIARKM